jgi:hypothetical protein
MAEYRQNTKYESMDKGNLSQASGEWKTVNGAKIFIEDGQSVDDAVKKHFAPKAVDKSPRESVQLSKQEYAVARQAILRKNVDDRGTYPYDSVFTANHYVMYENHGYDNFKVTVKLKIDGNEDLIKDLERIKNE